MKNDAENSEADREYAVAHAAHYSAKDLGQALSLYVGITAVYPESREAGYARSQIRNIAETVVSEQDLLGAQVDLIRTHLGEREPTPRMGA